MNRILLNTLENKITSRPPVWFMRQAGRILPSYRELKKSHHFYSMMKDKDLATKVTLLPINDLKVDAAILFSDILVIPDAMGLELDFTPNGPKFSNSLKSDSNNIIKYDPSKLTYIYDNIKNIKANNHQVPLIGFCGGPLTTFLFMFRSSENKKSFKEAIKFFYSNKKDSLRILEQITEASIDYAKNQVNSGIDVFQLFETYCGAIPYELYEELILPFSKKILNSVKEMNCPNIFFPKDFSLGLKSINKGICDFVSIDWHISLNSARYLVDESVGVQGNMDPRILYYDKNDIENYLNSCIEFGSKNNNWIFNLGHGFLPDIDYKKAQFVVDWIKKTNWNR